MRFFKITLTALFFCLFCSVASFAQDKSKRKSPPMKVEASFDDASVVIEYGAPFTRGREIWGKLVPYNKIWRTGANEATTFEVSEDVKINGKELKAGKYALFTIPSAKEWTIVFNNNPDQWGAYDYDPELDELRIKVKPVIMKENQDQFLIVADDEGRVMIRWDDLGIPFKVEKD